MAEIFTEEMMSKKFSFYKKIAMTALIPAVLLIVIGGKGKAEEKSRPAYGLIKLT
jgi:hypothetical protein